MSDTVAVGKYVKYIFIALILAIAAHSLSIYILQQIGELKDKAHDLDKEIAILKERLNYAVLIGKNTQAMEDAGSGGSGGYNAAEQQQSNLSSAR